MGSSKRTFLGGSLLAMSFLLTGAVSALEPDQSGAPPQSLPARPLPAFLDDKRSGDLQEAWRAREAEAKEAPRPQGSGAPGEPESQETEAMSAARDAMKRVGEANRQAPAVRQRAEELSRRFGADAGEIPGAAVVPPAVSGEPPAGQGEQTVVTAPEPTREGDAAAEAQPAGAGGATAALPEAAAETQGAATTARPPVPVARTSAHIPPLPPLPLRAPRAVTQDAAMRHYRPAAGSLPAAAPAPAPAGNGRVEVFPPYIRAFGWNSQPQ
jgi:hypothetical protein